MGIGPTGNRCLLVTLVSSPSRLPLPPARITPRFIPISFAKRSVVGNGQRKPRRALNLPDSGIDTTGIRRLPRRVPVEPHAVQDDALDAGHPCNRLGEVVEVRPGGDGAAEADDPAAPLRAKAAGAVV